MCADNAASLDIMTAVTLESELRICLPAGIGRRSPCTCACRPIAHIADRRKLASALLDAFQMVKETQSILRLGQGLRSGHPGPAGNTDSGVRLMSSYNNQLWAASVRNYLEEHPDPKASSVMETADRTYRQPADASQTDDADEYMAPSPRF